MAKSKQGKTSPMVGGAGLLARFWTDLVQDVTELGGVDHDLHFLSTPDGRQVVREMARVAVNRGVSSCITERLAVKIDYSLSLEQMITQGQFYFVDPKIRELSALVKGSGCAEVNLDLVRFSCHVRWPAIEKQLYGFGQQPASIEHLVALATQHTARIGHRLVLPLPTELSYGGTVWAVYEPEKHRRGWLYLECTKSWCGPIRRFVAVDRVTPPIVGQALVG